MLRRIRAAQFDRPATSGKTNPSFITCEADDGTPIEVVAKFSAACELREVNLAMETIAACLAGDLGLPIPEPYLVEFTTEWARLIPDAVRRERVMASSSVAFGSKLMTGGYRIWNEDTRIMNGMVAIASAIMAFDAFIQNPDRRSDNPNCLVKGDELRIFDHEMAFSHRLVLHWMPPWQLGGLRSLERSGAHIFRNELRAREIDFGLIKDAWIRLSDGRLSEYKGAIPAEWGSAGPAIDAAIDLVRDVRENIDGCVRELKRVLT